MRGICTVKGRRWGALSPPHQPPQLCISPPITRLCVHVEAPGDGATAIQGGRDAVLSRDLEVGALIFHQTPEGMDPRK